MSEFEITTTTEGPEPRSFSAHRFKPIHDQVEAAAPGEWVVVKGIDKRTSASLRTTMLARDCQVSVRKQDEDLYNVYILREEAEGQDETPEQNEAQGEGDTEGVDLSALVGN